jgi:glycosyltransferase involved in cell wall biosynthesis
MKPNVSIILPFHRDLDSFLESALESIRQSLDVKLQILLIDDRRTLSKFKYSAKDTLVVKAEGSGYAAALNTGIRHAGTEYIALMNSDDLSHPSRLITQISLIRSTGASVSLCGIRNFGSVFAHRNVLGSAPKSFYSKKLLMLGAYGANATLLGTSQFFVDKRWEDIDMSDWKFALDFYPDEVKESATSEILYFYRRHKNQVTQNSRTMSTSLLDSLSNFSKNCGVDITSNAVAEALAAPFLFPKLEAFDQELFIRNLNLIYNIFSSDLSPTEFEELKPILIRRLLLANNGRLLIPYLRSQKPQLSRNEVIPTAFKLFGDLFVRALR